MDNINEQYEPTEEEWQEIEEAILREEEEERQEAMREDREELAVFKAWLKENGMSWDREDVPNVGRRRG